MVVMIVERVSPSLRGTLSRWLLEVKAGVFVGKVSALVRDKLWEKVDAGKKEGAAVQIWSTNNEQGFGMKLSGERSRTLVDFEGITLIRRLPGSGKPDTTTKSSNTKKSVTPQTSLESKPGKNKTKRTVTKKKPAVSDEPLNPMDVPDDW